MVIGSLYVYVMVIIVISGFLKINEHDSLKYGVSYLRSGTCSGLSTRFSYQYFLYNYSNHDN